MSRRPGVGRRSLRFLERELKEAKGGTRPSFWYRRLHGRFTQRARYLREILGAVRGQG